MNAKLYQYAVILHPTEKEKEDGKSSQLVVDVKTILASDQNSAVLQAGRAIPDEFMDRLDRLEVVVRSF